MSLSGRLPPRARAKHRGVAHAAFAQGGLMFAEFGEDGGLVHGSFISHVIGTLSGNL
jgi:hypothetical protein